MELWFCHLDNRYVKSFLPKKIYDCMLIPAGLTATDAVLIVLVAALCNAVPTVLNGAIGSNLHIPFPIASRASFGYWFSYFAVVSRGVLAMFWFGVQTANGGTCVAAVSCTFIIAPNASV